MNSFRSVERALAGEIERQVRAVGAGEAIRQETRGWDDDRGVSYVMRVKETSDDYRYFPEPDLPPLRPDAAWLDEIRSRLPELPGARRARYGEVLGLSAYDADVIVNDPAATELFEAALAADPGLAPKTVSNWVTGEFLRLAKAAGGAGQASGTGRASGAELAGLLGRVADGSLSGTNAKEVFARHFETGEPIEAIVADLGLAQISDTAAIAAAVDEVLAANPAAVADYRAGKAQAVGFLVGQVMKATRGQANPAVVQQLLRSRLER
jgi:aspartyl-tRNA(Asn)/glutamyl-tRNA(Gln) amidotransferase subunit B